MRHFAFADERTLVLAGSKDLRHFYDRPGDTAVLFLSRDGGKSFQELILPGEKVTAVSTSSRYLLVTTNRGGYSDAGEAIVILVNAEGPDFEVVNQYPSASAAGYDRFNGESMIYADEQEFKLIDMLPGREHPLPVWLRDVNFILRDDNRLMYLAGEVVEEYDPISPTKRTRKKLSREYDGLIVQGEEWLLIRFNASKSKATVFSLEEEELYVEDESTAGYYRYQHFAARVEETWPYVSILYSFDYGKTWHRYQTKEFFTSSAAKGFYKDKLILLNTIFYDKQQAADIMVGAFEQP